MQGCQLEKCKHENILNCKLNQGLESIIQVGYIFYIAIMK